VSYQQQYDAENRLVVVTRTVDTSVLVTRFYYDADGNRVRQVTADGTSTLYIGQWYEESQSLSKVRVRTNYYYLGGQRVALRVGVVGQAGTVYWLHADPLGSLSEVSTGSTSLYGRQRY
jgi:YD repeat-containing protein